MAVHAFILLLALIIDGVAGDPVWLWKRLPHPVVLFGWLIEWCEKIGNHAEISPRWRLINGVIACFFLLAVAAMTGWIIARICHTSGTTGILLETVVACVFLAQKSLAIHVRAVVTALETKGLVEARKEVAKIVGRDPDRLDTPSLCRAAIESLAENSSDAVIAPAFWFLLLGLPGLFAYKMLNTADSMVGHRNIRLADFGFASARLDDLANYLPARLTAGLVVVAAFVQFGRHSGREAARVTLRDAKKHRSPNAGWPESAYAGGLGISLSGPRSYGEKQVEEPFQNENGHPPRPEDISAALILFWGSMAVFFIFVTALFAVFWLSGLFI